MIDYLDAEVRRLLATVEIMRSFYGDVEGVAEPLLPREAIDRALAAHRRHRGLGDVEVEAQLAAELPPFRANPARLLRVLLILLARVAEAAREGGAAAISLRVGASRGSVVFDLAWPADVLSGHAGGLLGDAEEPLRLLAEADGGTLEEGGGGAVVYRVPAMGAAREAGR